jgi:hypothetical protein
MIFRQKIGNLPDGDPDNDAFQQLFIPDDFILLESEMIKNIRQNFSLTPEIRKLIRESFARKNSYCEVPCHKKLIDGEYNLAIKTLWYSYRLIKFSLNIGKFGKIIAWNEANDFLQELKNIPKEEMTPEKMKELYKLWIKNGLLTELKKMFQK